MSDSQRYPLNLDLFLVIKVLNSVDFSIVPDTKKVTIVRKNTDI